MKFSAYSLAHHLALWRFGRIDPGSKKRPPLTSAATLLLPIDSSQLARDVPRDEQKKTLAET